MKILCLSIMFWAISFASAYQTRVGLMTPMLSRGADSTLAEEVVRLLVEKMHDVGGLDVFTESRMSMEYGVFGKEFPSYCREPRCLAILGTSLELNKMIAGSVAYSGGIYALDLTMVDCHTRSIDNSVAIEGLEGSSLEDLVAVAVSKMWRKEYESVNYQRYFGESVDNRREMLYSTGGYLAVALIYAFVGNDPQSGSLRDADTWSGSYDLSGLDPSLRTLTGSARARSMGNSYIAASKDAYGVFYNPAGLAWILSPEASFSHQDFIGLTSSFTASYVQKATRNMGWGHSFQYVGGSESFLQELYFGNSVAYRFDNLGGILPPFSVGGTLHISSIRTNGGVGIDRQSGTGMGFGLDIGILAELSDRIDLGIVFNNVPSFTSYNNKTSEWSYWEAGAPQFRVGGTFEVQYGTLLIAEGRIPFMGDLQADQNWALHGGVEQRLFGVILARMGAYKDMFREQDLPWHMTFGLGVDAPVREKTVALDISYDVNTGGYMRDVWDFSLRFVF